MTEAETSFADKKLHAELGKHFHCNHFHLAEKADLKLNTSSTKPCRLELLWQDTLSFSLKIIFGLTFKFKASKHEQPNSSAPKDVTVRIYLTPLQYDFWIIPCPGAESSLFTITSNI